MCRFHVHGLEVWNRGDEISSDGFKLALPVMSAGVGCTCRFHETRDLLIVAGL